ncbi:hypothetical protein G3I01_01785 [Gramella sp. MT6]|uniref:hypothetical protein n=1 Tax=Gramella sp. MT6 TaxID=2705471 RepID=UPI001C5EE57D|nr:hypothetical protein [Gramella sp. MT6]QYA24289.1 hypothetical protein G3I01_01785 [Gramella sp. MT6]
MKKVILFLLLFPLLGIAQEESRILHMFELKLKMNERQKFEEGMKKWKDCYLENGGTDTWNVWNRVQGESGVVAVTYFMDKWAEMDEGPEEADNACQEIFRSSVFPYVESMTHNMASTMPDYSKSPTSGNKVVWVTFFRTNNSTVFNEVIKDVSSTYKEAKGEPLGYWYDFAGGGQDDPDYMVSLPYKNFAGLDAEWDGPWDVYEQKHGKEKMTEMRDKFREALDASWAYMYKLNEDLSNQ